MVTSQLGTVVRQIRSLAGVRPSEERSDGELLCAFLAESDQSAFEAIVRRHGPMVLQVCRRAVGNVADAEDAFQATFLVLAQKGGSIRKRASLASWLHGVAHRMATNSSRAAGRRRKHERQAGSAAQQPPSAEPTAVHELQAILDEEIGRLPEIDREP